MGKLFTVAIYASLTRAKEGTPAFEHLSKTQVWLSDESHVVGAPTLETLSNGLFQNTPYRMFLSGTQTRGDGTEKLLQSVIGKTVYTLSSEDAIKGGYICNHDFKIIGLTSPNEQRYDDPLETKRHHFLYNTNVAQFIAKLCEAAVSNNQKVLVLMDEVEQLLILRPMMTVPFTYAVGSGSDKRLKDAGMETIAPTDAVEQFNKNEFPVLLGTSCISIGTNIFPMHFTVNWQGSGSEIRSKQGAVGRSVRLLEKSKYAALNPPKPKVTIIDFNIEGIRMLENQLKDRIEYYKQSGTPIKFVRL